ncbi:unnamed protein product, partial [Thlaspi arvense]
PWLSNKTPQAPYAPPPPPPPLPPYKRKHIPKGQGSAPPRLKRVELRNMRKLFARLSQAPGKPADSLVWLPDKACNFSTKTGASPITLSPIYAHVDPDSRSLLQSLHKSKNSPSSGLTETPLYPWILWYLWKARNKLVFEEISTICPDLVEKASSEALTWQAANTEATPKHSHSSKRNRTVAPPTVPTCYTDGVWNPVSKFGGMGWIIVDPVGDTIRENSSSRRFVASAPTAEALAVLGSLRDSISLEIKDMHIKSDSEVLINALTGGSELLEIAGILDDIRSLVPLFISIAFCKLFSRWAGKISLLSLSSLDPV